MDTEPLHPGEYVMYLRKSRADIEKEARGEMETLGKHERELVSMSKRMGIVVADIRRELVSGESIQDRHEFRHIMDEVMDRRWSGIVVHAVDRLGRGDMMEYGWILSVLQFTGTLIVTPGRTYDPSNREDMQQLQLQMFFANNELGAIKHRLRDGKEQAARDGQRIATVAPFGYRKVIVDGQKTLEPTEWAPTVVEIFEEVAAGAPLSTLSMRLIAREVPGKWNNRRIKTLIENPVYKGVIAWNRVVRAVESREGLALVKKTVRNDRPILADGLHDAIVSDELWEAANAMLGKNHKTRPATKFRNPLAGILRCEKCGRMMQYSHAGHREKAYSYYKHYKYSTCGCAPSRYEDVVAAVVSALEGVTEDLAVQIRDDGLASRRKAEKADLDRLLESCSRRIDRLMVLFEDDAIDIEEFRRRRRSIDTQIFQARGRLAEIEAMPDEDPRERIATLQSLVATLGDDGIDASARNVAAKKIIDCIYYAKEPGGDLRLKVELR